MTLITYKPARNIVNDIDRWFDNFWNIDYESNQDLSFNPEFEITENKSSYLMLADLPEMGKKDIDIDISDGMIRISGERKSSISQKNDFHISSRMKYGKFEKSFYLPEDGDVDKINAKMIYDFESCLVNISKPNNKGKTLDKYEPRIFSSPKIPDNLTPL